MQDHAIFRSVKNLSYMIGLQNDCPLNQSNAPLVCAMDGHGWPPEIQVSMAAIGPADQLQLNERQMTI